MDIKYVGKGKLDMFNRWIHPGETMNVKQAMAEKLLKTKDWVDPNKSTVKKVGGK